MYSCFFLIYVFLDFYIKITSQKKRGLLGLFLLSFYVFSDQIFQVSVDAFLCV
nr:MAG TPA: hypothetical protein [Caudoviricetes sp.]